MKFDKIMKYFLVSDSGRDGDVVTYIDKIVHDKDYVNYLELKLFSKLTYELYTTPKKFNSSLLNLDTGETTALGQVIIMACEKPDFNWLFLNYSYESVGVRAFAIPARALLVNVFT